jgi:hypothetical protein
MCDFFAARNLFFLYDVLLCTYSCDVYEYNYAGGCGARTCVFAFIYAGNLLFSFFLYKYISLKNILKHLCIIT